MRPGLGEAVGVHGGRDLVRRRLEIEMCHIAHAFVAQRERDFQLAWLADSSVDMAAHLQTLMDLIRKS